MAGRKKGAKSTASQAASKSSPSKSVSSGRDKIAGGVFHGGRNYVAGDEKAFAKLDLEKTDLQRLADGGHISGFGTSASKAKAAGKARKSGEDTSDDMDQTVLEADDAAEEEENNLPDLDEE